LDFFVEILFVDYNEARARILREALVGSGTTEHRVRVARTGVEALELLAGELSRQGALRPDLILLSPDLPVVSGLDVLGAVKADPDLRSIPVVILTLPLRRKDLAECYARGANSVVIRPVPLDALAETLRETVRYWTRINAPLPTAGERDDE
jgi:CheY-like chemotaxis protein